KAPGATTYGHQIDFSGRLSPAVAGTRVTLRRGGAFVAATAAKADGSFSLKVEVARPGPFQAEAAGVASNTVTVRIFPFLDTALIGARVAGSPLSLSAKLRPSYAGKLRIRVQRDGGSSFSQLFGPSADVKLGTKAIETFHVTVESVPQPGFAPITRTLPVS